MPTTTTITRWLKYLLIIVICTIVCAFLWKASYKIHSQIASPFYEVDDYGLRNQYYNLSCLATVLPTWICCGFLIISCLKWLGFSFRPYEMLLLTLMWGFCGLIWHSGGLIFAPPQIQDIVENISKSLFGYHAGRHSGPTFAALFTGIVLYYKFSRLRWREIGVLVGGITLARMMSGLDFLLYNKYRSLLYQQFNLSGETIAGAVFGLLTGLTLIGFRLLSNPSVDGKRPFYYRDLYRYLFRPSAVVRKMTNRLNRRLILAADAAGLGLAALLSFGLYIQPSPSSAPLSFLSVGKLHLPASILAVCFAGLGAYHINKNYDQHDQILVLANLSRFELLQIKMVNLLKQLVPLLVFTLSLIPFLIYTYFSRALHRIYPVNYYMTTREVVVPSLIWLGYLYELQVVGVMTGMVIPLYINDKGASEGIAVLFSLGLICLLDTIIYPNFVHTFYYVPIIAALLRSVFLTAITIILITELLIRALKKTSS